MSTFEYEIKPRKFVDIRGFNRVQAASYIGVSPTKFDDLVKGQRMPAPIRIGSRVIWDRHQLDVSFDELANESQCDEWDSLESHHGLN